MVCCAQCAARGVLRGELHMVCCAVCGVLYSVLRAVCCAWCAAHGVLHMVCCASRGEYYFLVSITCSKLVTAALLSASVSQPDHNLGITGIKHNGRNDDSLGLYERHVTAIRLPASNSQPSNAVSNKQSTSSNQPASKQPASNQPHPATASE